MGFRLTANPVGRLTVRAYSISAICIMVTILGPLANSGVQLPFYSYRVPAGFPSPAADHLEQKVSLDELLDLRAPHMYLVRIEGDSMIGAGIFPGDLAVVDRSMEVESGHIVIAAVDCEPVCKRLVKECGQIILKSENPKYPSRYMMDGEELLVWGVVMYSVRSHEKA